MEIECDMIRLQFFLARMRDQKRIENLGKTVLRCKKNTVEFSVK